MNCKIKMKKKTFFKSWKLNISLIVLILLLVGIASMLRKYPVNLGILFYSGENSPVLSQEVKIENITENMLILSVKNGICWGSRGNTLFVSQDNGTTWKEKATLPYPMFSLPYFKRFSLVRNLLDRCGIGKMKILNSGTILIFSGSYLWRSIDGGNSFTIVHRTKFPPLLQGWSSRDKEIFYGEYICPNKDNKAVNLWKSIDDAKSWFIVHTLPAGSISHIHAVQYDSYADRIWVATGDQNHECKIMYSADGGKTFEIIGQGSQEWRAVSLLFTEDFVYWGTDCPYKQNYIFRWDRRTGKRETVQKIDGPAYYSTQLDDGSLILATTVESGVGEWDASAHIWSKKRNDEKWVDIGGWEKISGIKSHGLLRLAHPNESLYIYLTPWYTEGHNTLFRLRIDEN